MELTVVIPAYNEGESVKYTIQCIRKHLPSAGILVVDDASTDKTGEIANKQKVRVITHKQNKGYGGALKTGMLSAKTKYVAFLDADMTYDPAYFPQMLDSLKKHDLDVVWGNRFGGSKNKMPFVRKIGNRILTIFFWVVTGKNVADCSSGQRVLKTSALKQLDLQTLPDDLDFITALSKRIVTRGLKFAVMPTNYEKRAGESKLSIFKHGIRMLKNIAFEK